MTASVSQKDFTYDFHLQQLNTIAIAIHTKTKKKNMRKKTICQLHNSSFSPKQILVNSTNRTKIGLPKTALPETPKLTNN